MTQTHAPREARTGRLAATAAFLWSLTAIPIGLWQLLDPEGGPFGHENYDPSFRLPAALPDQTGPALLVAAGVLGLVAARAKPRLWPLPALFAAVFGLVLSTIAPIAFAGYLCAFLIPAVAVAAPTLLARGTAGRIAAAAATVALLVVLGVTGVVDYGAAGAFLADLGRVLASMGAYMAVQVWIVVGAGIWTALTLRLLLAGREDRPAPAWAAPERAARWGRVASWIAFAAALPYGVVRMSWLTPWVWVGGPLDSEQIDMTTRVWGLCLGFAAISGGVLCLGMTYRWGARWPAWVPRVKGRPVPPMLAIVPATAAAALFTFVSVPMVSLGIRQDALELVWAFPFYVWGPALGAATLAYAIRRGVVTAR
ncbi:hypothetical protein [Glycomyces paridis]|uniref:Uncharacterized protein n=1 Tax=Glycomyces paridis TaxID=2126555 RepID=A0A4S8PSJ8_9ACTN|nr:hypothetical protein [Glycomyces paridis]THV31379.1 hypothetical protein E9998_03160 [Glycomyces paridis]